MEEEEHTDRGMQFALLCQKLQNIQRNINDGKCSKLFFMIYQNLKMTFVGFFCLQRAISLIIKCITSRWHRQHQQTHHIKLTRLLPHLSHKSGEERKSTCGPYSAEQANGLLLSSVLPHAYGEILSKPKLCTYVGQICRAESVSWKLIPWWLS